MKFSRINWAQFVNVLLSLCARSRLLFAQPVYSNMTAERIQNNGIRMMAKCQIKVWIKKNTIKYLCLPLLCISRQRELRSCTRYAHTPLGETNENHSNGINENKYRYVLGSVQSSLLDFFFFTSATLLSFDSECEPEIFACKKAFN